MSTPQERGGTSFIITNAAGKFLMQFRDGAEGIAHPLAWDLFGGAVEEGETLEQCCVREIEEELTIKAQESDFEHITTLTIDGVIEHLLRYKPRVEWGHFTLREGAGCGFFTQEEMRKIATIQRIKLFAGLDL